MKVRLNLATKPLVSQRKFFVSAWLAAVLGGLLFVILGWHVYSELRAQEDLRRREQDNNRVAAQLQSRREDLDKFFGRPENSLLKERVAFLNGFIDESNFDWTRMFMDLEKTLPVGVHIVSIQPQVQNGRMFVRFVVGAATDEAKLKFLRAMESSPAFTNVLLLTVRDGGSSGSANDRVVLELNAFYVRS